MSRPRIKAPAHHAFAYYHCVSRVVDKQFKFGPEEKALFVSLMEEYSKFCGVQIDSYSIMSNHFHLLVRVPRPPENLKGHEWLMERLKHLTVQYPIAKDTQQKILKYVETGAQELLQGLIEEFKDLMWDISSFMQLLKQRFSRRFNKLKERVGTLWESRFHSTLVEGSGEALASMAAYIELNPLRAAMVADPADYEWSSYGNACRGDVSSMEGIRRLVAGAQHVDAEKLTLDEAMKAYRTLLIGNAAMDSKPCSASNAAFDHNSSSTDENAANLNADLDTARAETESAPLGPTKSEILERVLAKERVPMTDFIRIRVRYFTHGAVVGSKQFVGGIFQEFKHRFGPKRTVAAHRFRGLDSKSLFTLRDLRKGLFG